MPRAAESLLISINICEKTVRSTQSYTFSTITVDQIDLIYSFLNLTFVPIRKRGKKTADTRKNCFLCRFVIYRRSQRISPCSGVLTQRVSNLILNSYDPRTLYGSKQTQSSMQSIGISSQRNTDTCFV